MNIVLTDHVDNLRVINVYISKESTILKSQLESNASILIANTIFPFMVNNDIINESQESNTQAPTEIHTPTQIHTIINNTTDS